MPGGDAYTGAYVQMGQAYEDLGQDDAAERRYKRAIEVDPQSATAYFYLAELYRRQGKLDDAIANFQKALELDPEMSEAQLQLGVAYQATGDSAKAQEIFSQLTGGEGESATGAAAAQALFGWAIWLASRTTQHRRRPVPGRTEGRSNRCGRIRSIGSDLDRARRG